MTTSSGDGGSERRRQGGPEEATVRRREDLDPSIYARKRAVGRRRKARVERAKFDPSPPSDDDWTIPDRTQLTRMPTTPEPVGEVMRGVVDHRKWGDRLVVGVIQSRWAEIVGEQLHTRCQPRRVANGILTIEVADPLWATQLRYLTDRIRLQVNEQLGEPMIDRVEIVTGRSRA